MTTESIETRAIYALSRVQRIGENMPVKHPMHQQVKSLKQQAQNILSSAFIQADELAYVADAIVRDHNNSISKGGAA